MVSTKIKIYSCFVRSRARDCLLSVHHDDGPVDSLNTLRRIAALLRISRASETRALVCTLRGCCVPAFHLESRVPVGLSFVAGTGQKSYEFVE